MSDQGNFRPPYNYTFHSFENMTAAEMDGLSEDEQHLYPIDYRHYFGNPVFPSPIIASETNLTSTNPQTNYLGVNYSMPNFSEHVHVSTDDLSNVRQGTDCMLGRRQNANIQSYNISNGNYQNGRATNFNFDRDESKHVPRIKGQISAKATSTNIPENSRVQMISAKEFSQTETLKDTYKLKESNSYENGTAAIGTDTPASETNPEVDDDTVDSRDSQGIEEQNDTGNVSDASTIIDDEGDEEETDEDDDENVRKQKSSKDKLTKKNKSKKKPRKQASPNMLKSSEKDFTCETCGKVVQTKRALEKHRNLHTGKYKCEECNKIFVSEQSLKNHMKVHEGFVGTEVCNVCDKTFYDKSSLNKHTLSVHMGIKNFQCQYCNMSFFAKKTYEEHVRVHTGERPFKCTVCPKSYKRISDLNHHLRLHKGEVSHTCEKCGEGFRRVSELNRHMMKHSGDTVPIKTCKTCSWCGLGFPTLKDLNRHFNQHLEALGPHANPVIIEKEKEKFRLVDDIFRNLKSNLNRPESANVTSKENTNLDHAQKTIMATKTVGMNVCPQMEEDTTYRVISTDPVQTVNLEVYNTPTRGAEIVTNDFKPGTANTTSICLEIASTPSARIYQSLGNETVNNSKKGNKIVDNFSAYTNSIYSKTEQKNIKQEQDAHDNINEPEVVIETDYPDVNDDYDGDTDIEEYEYTMGSSSLDGEDTKETSNEMKVNIKQEPMDDYSEDDNDGNINNHQDDDDDVKDPDFDLSDDYEDINSDHKDSDTKDPDFAPIVKRKVGRRKATIPRKKRAKIKQVKSEAEDSGEQSDSLEEPKTKGKAKRRKTSEVIDNAGIDLDTLECLQCEKVFAKKASLIKHSNIHRGTYSCDVCGKCFTTKKSLKIHTDNHEGRKKNEAVCNVCDKAFYDSSSLNKHIKTVHMDYKPFPCTLCDRKFSENKTLVEHMRVHTGEKPFACEICGKQYKRVGELNFHLRKHNGEVNLNCPECGKGFMRKGQLRQHMQLRHDKERPFRCFLCAKTFPTHPMLKDHQKMHASQRKFTCEKCGYKFHSKSKLEKHLKRKTNCQEHFHRNANGMIICQYCQSEFSSFVERKKHIQDVHPERSGHRCDWCGKKFNRSQALKIHMKIHYQIRDYKCTMCSAAFIQRHHLTQHIATHTGSRPYQCNVCLKTFAHNATLFNHMKHHSASEKIIHQTGQVLNMH